jgi:hypothetical protein
LDAERDSEGNRDRENRKLPLGTGTGTGGTVGAAGDNVTADDGTGAPLFAKVVLLAVGAAASERRGSFSCCVESRAWGSTANAKITVSV